MLARLILALLLAAFAVPAATAARPCHAASQDVVHHAVPADPGDAPDALAPGHVCIGCIPLADWSGARLSTTVTPRAIPVTARAPTLDLGEAAPPALPPPRTA